MNPFVRSASGQQGAEMKWTNHEKLNAYGVRIEGWPPHIPQRNPSSLSASQNQEILDCVQNGVIRFPRLVEATPVIEGYQGPSMNYTLPESPPTVAPVADDFSWAYKSHGTVGDVSSRIKMRTAFPNQHVTLGWQE